LSAARACSLPNPISTTCTTLASRPTTCCCRGREQGSSRSRQQASVRL
jgi:hypothetical protein